MNTNCQLILQRIFETKNRTNNLAMRDLSVSNRFFDAGIYWCRLASSQNWSFSEHKHSFLEIHFCLHGCTTVADKYGNVHSLNPGQFIVFPVGHPHRFLSYSDSFEKLVLGFDLNLKPSPAFSFLSDAYNNPPVKARLASENMFYYTQRLGEQSNSMHPASSLIVSNILSEFIIETAQIINPFSTDIKSNSKCSNAYLDSLICFMQDNLSRHLTSKDFAAELDISIKHLNRLMQRHYHMSVSAYFRHERLKKAKQLLADTSLSLAEIAERVGYSDEFSFNKAFKHALNMTPGHFRAQIRSGSVQKKRS